MMHPESVQIVGRFLLAIDVMCMDGAFSITQFCEENGIDRRNLHKLRKDPSRHIFQPHWLGLVEKYGFPMTWLMHGVWKCANKMQMKRKEQVERLIYR